MLKKELTEHHLLIKKVFFFEKKHNFPSKNDHCYSLFESWLISMYLSIEKSF